MQSFAARLTSLLLAARLIQPGIAEVKVAKPEVEGLITRLTELDAESVGLSPGMTGGDFPPVAGQFSFEMGLLSPRPPLSDNAVLTQLVALGPDAMPALLKHLDDKRPTKLVIEHNMGMGGMWYATEILDDGQKIPDINMNYIDKHTIMIGDVCFVALGMITNRAYSAIRYQPTACIVINSPVQSPELAKAVRTLWGPAGEKAGRDQLLAWLRNDLRHGSTGAATRLLYYFPDETPAEMLEELRKPGRTPYEEQYLLRATGWTPHAGIRAEVQKKVLATDVAPLAESGAAAFGGGKDPADYDHLTKLIARWKSHKDGSSAAQAFMTTALASWPDRREQTLDLFFKNASRDCLLAGIDSCYNAGPLPVRPLIPLLGRNTEGHGRYLINGEGVRDKPEDSDFLSYRVCDNIWEVISRSLGDTKSTCTGDRQTMDRRITELQARLKNDAATWPYSAAEIEVHQAEQNRIARAKAAALQEVDGKKPAPALRALLILQDDRAGMELWLKSVARLLHPADKDEDDWSFAVANRHHHKTHLLDELTPDQRETFEKTLTRRAMTSLDSVPRAAWPGEDATALVQLCSCVTKHADHPALKAAVKRLRAAFAKHSWPEDSDLSRLIKTMEVLLERRTPGTGPLLLQLAETSNPEVLSMEIDDFFSLIAEGQDLPEGVKAAEYCFQNRKSPWLLSKGSYSLASEFGNARLLNAPAFRKALATALSNEAIAGQLTIKPDKLDYCWIEWKSGGSAGMGVNKDEPIGVKPGAEMPVRACDALLEGIRNAVFSGYQGPDFKIYWPLEKRDAARKEWLVYLTKPK